MKFFTRIIASVLVGATLASGLFVDNHNVCADALEINYEAPDINIDGISEFVTRMYQVCLDRTPDETGLEGWVTQLTDKTATGCSVAYGFIFSNEFQNKNCTNEEYVTYMYSAFFGRTPDSAGLNDWVTRLDEGASRESVFCGFANSNEFDSLCRSFGVIRGFHIEGYNYTQVAQVNLFVNRLYNVVLLRECDGGGMSDWTTQLLSHTNTGAGVAYGFIFSPELIKQNLCNSCYLDTLYRAIMGREADSNGFESWLTPLNAGEKSREEVFAGFIGSQEFLGICESYGVDVGSVNISSRGTVTHSDTYIDVGRFTDTSTRNNIDIVTMAYIAHEQQWAYAYGTYGQVGSSGRRMADCSGLIKAYFWFDFETGQSIPGLNDFNLASSEDMWARATVKSSDFSTMPDVMGLGLWRPGHVGIYIGNGMLIDAGYGNGSDRRVSLREFVPRAWSGWFEIPGLEYVQRSPNRCERFGEQITFGTYQGHNLTWTVYDQDGDNLMLVADTMVDIKPFNSQDTDSIWDNSTLRAWLNGDFYSSAFSSNEQSRIVTTTVAADGNSEYPYDVQVSTEDKVYLLSIDEYNRYRIAAVGDETQPSCWLRTNGNGSIHNSAVTVSRDGTIEYAGESATELRGVRPVIWITSENSSEQ